MFDTSWLKVFSFLGIWTIVWLPIALVISQLIDWRPDRALMPKQKLILLISLYLLSPIVLGWKIQVENLSFASLGLSLQPNVLFSILLGLLFSLLSLVVIFIVESIFNLISWQWSYSKQLLTLVLPILTLSLFISIIEEAIFRGYIFSTLLTDYPWWFAAVISSLIFSLLHLVWNQQDTLPQIPGLWLMGMILIGARIINNGSIGLAIGLHAGWIWGLTYIDSTQLLTYRQKNSWLTGFNQQPLAGIAGISCLIVTGFILWLISVFK
jgi:uncharacterized protein